MSKELEARKCLIEVNDYGDMCNYIANNQVAYKLVKQALTPPTADEVCEAIKTFLGGNVTFKNGEFIWASQSSRAVREVIVERHEWTKEKYTYQIMEPFPSNIITIIGRFYEGEE